jgi:hypothetical protein
MVSRHFNTLHRLDVWYDRAEVSWLAQRRNNVTDLSLVVQTLRNVLRHSDLTPSNQEALQWAISELAPGATIQPGHADRIRTILQRALYQAKRGSPGPF